MSARSAVHGALALVFLLSAPAAFADPAGKSTTDETIRPASGSGYVALERKSGRGPRDPPPPVRAAFGPALARPDVARVLRPAHRPADRRRDVSGAGGLPRPGGQRGVVVVAPDGDLRAAGVRPDRAQHEREPDERGARAWRQVREARLRDHDGRSRGQPAAQRDALVHGRARGRDRSTRSPARRSAPRTRAAARRRTRSRRSTRRSRRAPTPAWPTTTTGAASRPSATPASGTRTKQRPRAGRMPPSRATPGCSSVRRRRSPRRA